MNLSQPKADSLSTQSLIHQFAEVLHTRQTNDLSSIYGTPTENKKMWVFPMQQGPAHYMLRLPKHSQVCCFFLCVDALHITLLFVVTLNLGLRMRLKGRCEGYEDIECETAQSMRWRGGGEEETHICVCDQGSAPGVLLWPHASGGFSVQMITEEGGGLKEFYISRHH